MKLKQLLGIWLFISCLSIIYLRANAQGWEKLYSPDRNLSVTTLTQLHDQSYYASGSNIDNYLQFRLMRIAVDGSVMWVHDYDSLSLGSWGVVPHDGGYASIGWATYDPNANLATRASIRVDSMGNKKWLKFIPAYPGNHVVGNMSIDTTDNNGFIYTVSCYATDTSTTLGRIIRRLDANGDILWSRSYFDGDSTLYLYKIRNAKDGGFLVNMNGGSSTNGGSRIFKIDSVGNILWQVASPFTNATIDFIMAHDGNVLINGNYFINGNYSTTSTYLGKIDQSGHQLWLKDYGPRPDSLAFGSIIENNNHTYTALGGRYSPVEKFFFFLVDSTHVITERRIPQNFQSGFLYNAAFIPTADHGYLLGVYTAGDPNHRSIALIKMDSLGTIYPHLLSGKVYLDLNNNCVKNPGESYLNNSLLTFTNATDTFTAATNDSGYYSVGLNNGVYNLNITPLVHYTVPSSCMPTQISITGIDSIVDMAVTPTAFAPYINVSAVAPQRECFITNNYKAQYCNNGTAPFTGTISITIDSLDVVDSASTPWILPQTGNIYQFTIDTLDVMECATVNIYYHLPCDPNLLHRTLCIDADVYSDTVINPSLLWDRSNLIMTAHCNLATDSVEFRLKNTGSGNTNTPVEMIVIEDNVISVKHVGQLAASTEYLLKVSANGATWRATAQQTPNNPYSSFTTAAVEGCGVNQLGQVSQGFLMQYPDNGYYAFHNTTCALVSNSYDPNHKTVSPEGAGTDHLVDSTTELRYTIDFQNTGNDTAYLVRLVDTLADYLDVATIQPGVSSHPYVMDISENKIATFTFYNIMLPDSGHNQIGSNGYVQFKIKQKHNNRIGTVINNDAAIYFDYNAPVITNTATVSLGTLKVDGIENLYTEKAVLINAFPNPFNTQTVIKVDGEIFNQLDLIVYDVTGKIMLHQAGENINQFTLARQAFSSGSYVFEISCHGKMVGRGKIIAD